MALPYDALTAALDAWLGQHIPNATRRARVRRVPRTVNGTGPVCPVPLTVRGTGRRLPGRDPYR